MCCEEITALTRSHRAHQEWQHARFQWRPCWEGLHTNLNILDVVLWPWNCCCSTLHLCVPGQIIEILKRYGCFCYFLWWCWEVSPGTYACPAGALPRNDIFSPFCFDRVSLCTSEWPGTCCIVQDELGLKIVLPLGFWDYRLMPLMMIWYSNAHV